MHAFERVSVWETVARRWRLTNVEEAARWLLEKWPTGTVKPRSYGKALRTCLDALNGKASAASAREALVKVADDAGILDQA